MKPIQLITVFLITVLLSCQNKKNEVVITGTIQGEIPEEVFLALPVNGVYYLGFKETVKPDSSGHFTFKTTVEQPAFAGLLIYGKFNGNFIIEPGENYEILLNLDKKVDNFVVNCNSQKGQTLYSSLPNPPHVQFEAYNYLNLPSAAEMKKEVTAAWQKDINAFNTLYKQGEISEAFMNLIKTDRDVFYSAMLAELAKRKWSDDIRGKNGAFSEDMKNMWSEAILNIPVKDKYVLRSRWNTNFLQNYLDYKEYMDESYGNIKHAVNRNQDLYHTQKLKISKEYLEGEVLEFHNAAYLYIECLQKKYEKELITLFDEFKRSFPNSEYIKFLDPMVAPIIEFHERSELPFNDNIRFIENFENMNTLNECLKNFRGKKVYADIWSTSCGYCKDEFKYSEELKQYLNSQDIAMLYISLDGENTHSLWQNMIKYYNLSGYHLRASKALRSDMDSLLGRFGIPRYLLIDENGQIITDNASRPSQLNELKKEISEFL